MARLDICDGRKQLYQWDTGVHIELCGCRMATECHFVTAHGLIKRDVVDGICNVPDAALQQAGPLTVYAFTREDDGSSTRHEFRLRVFPRPKPADYIDPPDEADNLEAIYDRLKDEIVGPAGTDGKDGTSVTITSITESTEDGGENVVTFSDGKTLRVKNGSKGSDGEGGSGSEPEILWVNCTPSDDVTTFTADKTLEEIAAAAASGKLVQASMYGVGICVPLVMIEGMAVFCAVAVVGDQKMAVALTMTEDGTNLMSLVPLNGVEVVTITTEDGTTWVADKYAGELYDAASVGIPVYCSINGGFAPAQLVTADSAFFRITIPGGAITATIDSSSVTVEIKLGTADDLVYVDVEEQGDGTYTTSMQVDALYTAYAAGSQIVCRAKIGSITNTLLYPTITCDTCVFFTAVVDQTVLGLDDKSLVTIAVTNSDTAIVKITSLNALPNPHPLTINGVSYDGSEAVEITEPEYELIETITVDEETEGVLAIERTEYGAMQNMLITAYTPQHTANRNVFCSFFFADGQALTSGGVIYRTDDNGAGRFKARQVAGIWDVGAEAGYTSSSSQLLGQAGAHKAPLYPSDTGDIVSVKIYTFDTGFTAGTTFHVFGVRA